MEPFIFTVAQTSFSVETLFGSTREYFRKYLSLEPAECAVSVTPEDLQREQQLLNEEADREGIKRRVFTEPFLERTVIQRKTAAFLAGQRILLLHGSTVVVDGSAYLFTADCGVGKSTHTRLWRELLGSRAVMLNDDRAFLRLTADGVLAYGSPWSGKHGLDTNLCVPLKGICILRRGAANQILPIAPSDGLSFLKKQVFLPAESQQEYLEGLLAQIVSAVPLWQMECTKDISAAQLAYESMRQRER